jgi:hypothetical protein
MHSSKTGSLYEKGSKGRRIVALLEQVFRFGIKILFQPTLSTNFLEPYVSLKLKKINSFVKNRQFDWYIPKK